MVEHLKPHFGQIPIALEDKVQKVSQEKRQQRFAEHSKGMFQVV